MTRFGEIAFIDDCGAKIGVVEGADSNKTLCNIGRDKEITKTFRDGVRVFSGRKKLDGTRVGWSEGFVIVEESKSTSDGDTCAGV